MKGRERTEIQIIQENNTTNTAIAKCPKASPSGPTVHLSVLSEAAETESRGRRAGNRRTVSRASRLIAIRCHLPF